jgi:hypothetical protein
MTQRATCIAWSGAAIASTAACLLWAGLLFGKSTAWWAMASSVSSSPSVYSLSLTLRSLLYSGEAGCLGRGDFVAPVANRLVADVEAVRDSGDAASLGEPIRDPFCGMCW